MVPKSKNSNDPPKRGLLEEIGNAVTHGVGAGLSVAGFILLLLRSDTGLKIMASCFYGICLILLFLMSCLYHSFKSGLFVKKLWRRFDYSSIYLLIGGTFAPFCLVYLGNTAGIVMFCIQWGLIIVGVTFVGVFGPGKLRWLHFTLYFLIGWSAVILIPHMVKNDLPLFLLTLAGGLLYTFGMVPFAEDKKGDHFIWHIFVLLGAVVHWFAIFMFIF